MWKFFQYQVMCLLMLHCAGVRHHSVPLFSVQPYASVSVCHLEKLLQLRGAARFFVRWKSLQQTSLIHKFNSAKCTIVKSIWRIMSGKIHAETKPRANPWQQRLRETPRSYWELCQFSVPLSKGKRTDLSRKKIEEKKFVKMLWGSVKEGGLPSHPLRKIIREDSMGSLDVSSFSSESNDSSYHGSPPRQYSQTS